MPSFTTLLIAATAALVGFTAATSLGHTESSNALSDALGAVGGNTKRQDNSFGGLDAVTGPVSDYNSALGDLGAVSGNTKRSPDSSDDPVDGPDGPDNGSDDPSDGPDEPSGSSSLNKRNNEIRSLPVILLAVKADLLVVLGDCKDIIAADANVDVKVLVPFLTRVGAILGAAVVEIQVLAGKSVEIVLVLGGSVISVVECAKILANVLVIVYSILAIVIQVAGSVKAEVIVSAVALVSGCVGELLIAAFIAVDGLLVALVPLIDTVINLSHVWVFADILAILKV